MRSAFASALAISLSLSACTNGDADDAGNTDMAQDDESGPGEESNTGNETGEAEGTDEETTGDETTGDETTGDETDTGEPCPPFDTSDVAGCAEIVGQGFCSEGASHVPEGSDIEWLNNPPHSGNHYPSWETKGEHVEAVARGNWVHNLEHGWVIFVHNCPADCEAELDMLRSVIETRPNASILMTPDPLLDGPRFAAITWTWVHEFDAPDLDELLCFVDQHHDNAPESVH